MSALLIVICIATLFISVLWTKRWKQNRDLESHSISPETLYSWMQADREVMLFDVRRPLDLLIDLEIIPGSTRIPPKKVQQNPSLLPNDKETVVYCTSPGDKTARRIVHMALRMKLTRVKLLRGGFPAWKAKGYPVVPYNEPFRLDTAS